MEFQLQVAAYEAGSSEKMANYVKCKRMPSYFLAAKATFVEKRGDLLNQRSILVICDDCRRILNKFSTLRSVHRCRWIC